MTAVRRILILLFWTLSEAAVAASGRGASVAELDALNRAELDALVRGDYAAAAGFYAGDAILLPPDGTVVRGRSAIETYWRALEGSTL
jgi:ketosteroid isomerase-like protein